MIIISARSDKSNRSNGKTSFSDSISIEYFIEVHRFWQRQAPEITITYTISIMYLNDNLVSDLGFPRHRMPTKTKR